MHACSTVDYASQRALRQRGETRHRIYCLLRGMFSDATRYLARDGDVEIWKIINISPDTHPVHVHLVQFKLLAREPYTPYVRLPDQGDQSGGYATAFDAAAPAVPADLADAGWKDTLRANPAQMTVIAVPFRHYAPEATTPAGGQPLGYTGRYMYHCHVLEHEDHEMMRPYVVMPPAVIQHMRVMGAGMSGMMGMPGDAEDGWYMAPELCCCREPMPDMTH